MSWIPWSEALLRWGHVLAGVVFLGLVYFVSFVGGPFLEACDAPTRERIEPRLLARAYGWLRWGAAGSWAAGFCLLGLVYYMPGSYGRLVDPGMALSQGAAIGLSLGLLLFVFFAYDALWTALSDEKREPIANAVSFAGVVALAYGLSRAFNGRSMFLHLGALFGTILTMNVWMRIGPARRKIRAGVAGAGLAGEAASRRRVALREKHNAYLSLPLIFFMVSNHVSQLYDSDFAWEIASGVVAVGFFVARWLFAASARVADLPGGTAAPQPAAGRPGGQRLNPPPESVN